MSVLGPGKIIKNGSPCQIQGGVRDSKPSPSAPTTWEVGFGAGGFEVSLVALCGHIREGPDGTQAARILGPCRGSAWRHGVRAAEAQGVIQAR